VQGRKLAGVLVETRWQDQRPVWVAVGVGINVEPPQEVARATGLRAGTSRLRALEAVVAALRAADDVVGPLLPAELAEFARRDIARGQRSLAPAIGRIEGIAPTGELLIRDDQPGAEGGPAGAGGAVKSYRSGSLILEGEVVS
jgi:biotin-(acetyl-CoA carboxylase) ligase